MLTKTLSQWLAKWNLSLVPIRACSQRCRLMCMPGRVCPSAWHYLAVGGHYSQTWENSAQERVAMLHALYSIFSSPKWGPLLAKVHRLLMKHMSVHTGLISSYQLLITAACTNTGGKMKGSHSRAADRCPFVLGQSLSQVTSFMQFGMLWQKFEIQIS